MPQNLINQLLIVVKVARIVMQHQVHVIVSVLMVMMNILKVAS